MISDIAAGSCMKGNARGALLLRGSRVGASCGEITRHDGWSEARPIKSARESIARRKERLDCFASLAMTRLSLWGDAIITDDADVKLHQTSFS
jgi:hypothetical protein